MLKLPVEGDALPPLVVERVQAPEADSVPMMHHRPGKRSDEFDETFSRREPVDRLVKRIVVATALTMVAVLFWGLLWSRGKHAETVDSGDGSALLPPAPERMEAAPRKRESSQLAKVEIGDLEPAIRGVFENDSGDPSAWLLHAETSLSRFRGEPGGERQMGTLKEIHWSVPFAASGEHIGVAVQNGDYEGFCVWLAQQDGRWKVDWESTVGWSPKTFEALTQERPTEPVAMRVRVLKSNYYNFAFADDDAWQCFRIESANGEDYLYGYAEAGSLTARTLNAVQKERNAVTLSIRFPEGSDNPRQVIIDSVISESWVADIDSP
ncbi:YD repeat-containing protein [Haloferula luteola]|uniref:YD repeat-containing protein n=1 Tax=Haloferula luteola TaxID=595692 RepID=A0A840V3K0_9BACT|nr:hypothetical protein [Haloferula luteola]MBB5352575.1 YD repeat-containing protein [Haloferula luteola]